MKYKKENGILYVNEGFIFKKWIPLIPHMKEKHPKMHDKIKDMAKD